jgi:hypothetical protein
MLFTNCRLTKHLSIAFQTLSARSCVRHIYLRLGEGAFAKQNYVPLRIIEYKFSDDGKICE